ncbi:MAG: protease pro-enzyme activation domain-containing protein [Pseudomonadota bacterium]|nr:protease pro-enzyme activation domain-containing protein [Pseudomonadota bacterium]
MDPLAPRHTVPGSERQLPVGGRVVGPVPPDERIDVTLQLRAKVPLAPSAGLSDAAPRQRVYLTREQFAAQHGADPADIEKVATFAARQGLHVVSTDPARRSVALSGPYRAMGPAFGVRLQQYAGDSGSYRSRVGSISVPAELGDVVEGVFGLDDRPQADPA